MEQFQHVKIVRVRDYNEYRVAYRGLKKDREEAMAYYTDDREDAEGTARTMEERALDDVVYGDIKDYSAWPEFITSKSIGIRGR